MSPVSKLIYKGSSFSMFVLSVDFPTVAVIHLKHNMVGVLHQKILEHLNSSEYPETICPSEVAGITKAGRARIVRLGCMSWRDAMEPIKQEAWSMINTSLLGIT